MQDISGVFISSLGPEWRAAESPQKNESSSSQMFGAP